MQVSVDVTPEVVAALQNRATVREARHTIEHTVRALLGLVITGGERSDGGFEEGRGQILTGSGDDAVVTEG
jgi:hypothetical protein